MYSYCRYFVTCGMKTKSLISQCPIYNIGHPVHSQIQRRFDVVTFRLVLGPHKKGLAKYLAVRVAFAENFLLSEEDFSTCRMPT